MHYLPPFVVDGTHIISPDQLERQVEYYKRAILYLCNELDVGLLSEDDYFNDFIRTKLLNHE